MQAASTIGMGDMVPGSGEDRAVDQPRVGHDPTQGTGTSAWQQALRMGMQINARNRRN